MLGRRGPAQAAFTPPELKELGELAGADVIVDPADLELDAASAGGARGRPRRAAAERRDPARVRRARAGGQAAPAACCASSSRRSRSSATAASRRSRSSATSSSPATTAQIRAVPTDEREMIPCGARPPQRRLPRRPACRACRSTRRAASIPNEGGRVLDDDGEAVPRRLLRRLDQARPERRHRHEQEGRDRDRRAAARGRARRACSRARPTRRALEAARRARRASSSSTRAGRRSTRPSATAASRRPPAREARRAGTSCSSRAREQPLALACALRRPAAYGAMSDRGKPATRVPHDRENSRSRALGRRDAQGGRELPGLRRADPGRPSRAGSAGSRPRRRA